MYRTGLVCFFVLFVAGFAFAIPGATPGSAPPQVEEAVLVRAQDRANPGQSSFELDEGPYLVLATTSVNNSLIRALNDLDIEHDFVSTPTWSGQNLDDYGTVIIGMDGGTPQQGDYDAVVEFCENGGTVLFFGGTGLSSYPPGMSGFIENNGNWGWRITSNPQVDILLEDHALAEGLEDDHDFTQRGCGYFCIEVTDEDAEVVAENGDGWPIIMAKEVGDGVFLFFTNTAAEYWWSQYEDDYEYLAQIMENFINYSVGSAMLGQVTNSVTGAPVAGAVVNVYDAEQDTLWSIDTTDVDGYYEVSEKLKEEFSYYAVFSAENYVPEMVEDIEFVVPEDVVVNVALNPILDTNCEEIQTEVTLDSWVNVAGIVTQPTNSTTTEMTSFYIQDGTNYGVQVWSEAPWNPENNLNRGDSVRVVGRVDEIDGVTIITDLFEYEVYDSGHDIPFTLELSTGAMSASHDMEGAWGHVHGYLQDDPQEGSFMIRIDDNSGTVWVHVLEPTGIDAMEGFESGDWFYVDGVISIYEGNVQVIPSLPVDVWRTQMYPPTHFIALLTDTLNGYVELEWGLYRDGGMELDEFREFAINRDGEEIARTRQYEYVDTLQIPEEPGDYEWIYTITSIYHEGEMVSDEQVVSVEVETDVDESDYSGLPENFAIESVYPNPFNPTVRLQVAVPVQGDITLQVFDLNGRLVDETRAGNLQPGYHKLNWTAGGPSGIYFLKVSSATGWSEFRKAIFIK